MKRFIGVVIGGLALVGSARSEACSCAATKEVAAELKSSTAVFSGTVTSVAKENRSKAVTLKIAKRWKGLDWQQDMVVRTAGHGAACGYGFAEKGEYLVYAYLAPNGTLTTNICTRTKELSTATSEVAELDKLVD